MRHAFQLSRILAAVVPAVAMVLGVSASTVGLAGDVATYDVVIYGGTSAAITAAVQAKAMGKSVVVVSPDKHLGGLSSGGLGWTDSGNKAVIGGLARQFYHRIWQHYQQPAAWKWQKAEEYGNRGQGTAAIDQQQRTMWIFEPHVAEQVFDAWIEEVRIPVVRNAWLDRAQGVKLSGRRITSITTLDGKTYAGRMFIDASYEGDLMAAAGVSYHVGREAGSVYGEQWNGVQVGTLHHTHWFKKAIDPYVVPGDPSSGLLPRIGSDPPGQKGEADARIQAYCFRMCLTDVPENRVPFAQPERYDPRQYELLLRVFDGGWRETFQKFDPIPNHKTDTNNHGPFSTDNIGCNYDYPNASYERRREIIAEHETYQKGLMYFLANEPRVPEDVRTKMSRFGLAKDEFVDNDHWPHQLYIREARRMIGRYVMTESEILKKRPTPESIGMGSYTIDSHNVQRYVTPERRVQNEGDIGVKTVGPYPIAYGSIVPKEGECENLLVPVCLSSSHIAYGSIRMEPVLMLLAQSAATAAILAIDSGTDVQHVSYAALQARLEADGQVLAEASSTAHGQPALRFTLRSRVASPAQSDTWQTIEKPAAWNPRRTAVVICDMWDNHWCRSATARVAEMAPRMNQLVVRLREQGVLVIHCPSDTLDFYQDTPPRRLAQQAPAAPPRRNVEVKEGPFPIDHADGGCPDEPKCRQGKAWTRQIATLEIRDGDAVAGGDEAYNLMRQRGIEQVIIMGVHTNMCVLNRPFTIRALVHKGMSVVLVRDMTDTMYNPAMRPFVDHFTGTDLVVEFIEKYWCPTITSDQVLGGKPFCFAEDRRR